MCRLYIITKSVENRRHNVAWDLSSAGRASALQAEGHRFEPCRSHYQRNLIQFHMARWLNWLERPVHTREVESSSLSLATSWLVILFHKLFYFINLNFCLTFVQHCMLQSIYKSD